MGAYYIFANHTQRTYVDPGEIPNGSIKRREIYRNEHTAKFVAWLLLEPWAREHVVALGDEGVDAGASEAALYDYRNATAELAEEFAEAMRKQ